MAAAEFLRNVPVFAGLSEELLEQIAKETETVSVPAGQWVLREGDEAESLFLIRSGRLDVVDEGPPETLIRVLRRGQVLGELALLAGGRRSVSVRARRDSELLEISRSQFERLINDAPGFALGLVRAMGAQLAASRAPAASDPQPHTVAVLGLDPAVATAGAADLLRAGMADAGTVAVLTEEDAADPSEMAALLDRALREHDRVILVGSAHMPGDPWTDFCLRESDLIVALTTGRPSPPWLQHPDALKGCELIAMGAHSVSAELLEAFAPREAYALQGGDLERSLAAIARRITGRAVGVVLSGGGARAFAHLGVVEELSAAGLVIDRIAGVSLGSIVGAGMAMGTSADELTESFREGFGGSSPTGDYTIPLFSMVRGNRTRHLLRQYFGDNMIEALPIRYFCLSCDLVGREAVVHRTGLVADAVMASLSIPGVFPPVPTADGRLLVDGGVLDNLPVKQMAATGEGPVIAIDVTGKMGGFRKPPRPGIARLARPLRRYLTGGEGELPRLGETIVRTVTVGSVDTATESSRHADLVIEPPVEGIGMLDWKSIEAAREAGRDAARQTLETTTEWRAW